MEGAQAKVKINGVFSESFELGWGLKQGSIFSPLLFNLFFGAVIEAFKKRIKVLNFGVRIKFKLGGDILNIGKFDKRINEMTITELLYADDAELIAESEEDL